MHSQEKYEGLKERLTHNHSYGKVQETYERRTLYVVILTFTFMILEVVAGYWTGSMALLADGWHMGTHGLALLISLAAYIFARKYQGSVTYSFGTGKFSVLASFVSSLFVFGAAASMIYESIERLLYPEDIDFFYAILVAVLGMCANLVSALILELGVDHDGGHHHHHDHHEGHHHISGAGESQDLNYRAVYIHVLTDTLTSVFAIIALLFAKYLGWTFMDPLMGLVGAALITSWGWGLLIKSTGILLDKTVEGDAREQVIQAVVEVSSGIEIVDLHVWYLSSSEIGVLVVVIAPYAGLLWEIREAIAELPQVCHVTVEFHALDESLEQEEP